MESILDDSASLSRLAVYQSLHIQEENGDRLLNYRTAETWISRASSTSTAKNRKNLLQTWALANKLTDLPLDQLHDLPLYSAVNQGIQGIKDGLLDPYDTANAMVVYMLQNKRARSSTYLYRNYLPIFFRFCKVPVDKTDYNDQVKKVPNVFETESRTPTPAQIRELLIQARPKTKALIAVMVSTGCRINEAVQLKLSDIDFDRIPTRVSFRAETTKTYKSRTSFLSKEAAEMIKNYLRNRLEKSKWLFSGFDRDKSTLERSRQEDPHLKTRAAHATITNAFKTIGLHSRSDKTNHHLYHPHTFRVLNLAISKTHGFPPDWAEQMVGHNTGTQGSYIPYIDNVAIEWLEKVEPHMTFLNTPPQAVEIKTTDRTEFEAFKTAIAELREQNQQLAAQLKALTNKPQA
jgi:integrase